MQNREIWTIDNFTGGLMLGTKKGVAGSYVTGTGLDARTDPDGFTIGRVLTLDSSTTVADLVLDMTVVDIAGTPSVFALGTDANYYRKTGTGAWALIANLTGNGKGCGVFNDYFYYARDTNLGRYGLLSGTPSAADTWQTLTTVPSMNGFAGLHPMCNFMNMICIGNARYLATYDSAATWTADKLTFPPDTLVTSLAVWGDRIAIGTADKIGKGFVYLWDGVSSTYNSFFEVPTGGVHCLLVNAGVLYIWAGVELSLYAFSGGSPFDVYNMPKVGAQKYAEIYHGGSTVFEGVPLFAVTGNTDSTTLTKGIYSYGAITDSYPDVLALDTIPSNAGATLRIGSCLAVGQNLYVGWQSATGQGIDKLGTAPLASATYESPVFDAGRPANGMTVYEVIINCSPLAANETITVQRKADRGSWVSVGTMTTDGDVKGDFPINNATGAGYLQCSEFQLQVVISQTGGTAPTIYSISTVYSVNDLT